MCIHLSIKRLIDLKFLICKRCKHKDTYSSVAKHDRHVFLELLSTRFNSSFNQFQQTIKK